MTFKVLYVCLGNTCRSPVLADLMDKELKAHYKKDVVTFSSAAITKYNLGNPIDPLMKQVALEKGVKLKRHKASLATEELITQSDLIFGVTEDVCEMVRSLCKSVDEEKKVLLATHFSLTYLDTDILDPFSKEKNHYEEVFRQIQVITTETLQNKKFISLCGL